MSVLDGLAEKLIVLDAAEGAIVVLKQADEQAESLADKRYFKVLAELVAVSIVSRPSTETMLLIGAVHAITGGLANQALLSLRDGLASEVRRAGGTPITPNLN